MKLIYDIRDLVPYINWAYFYFAWQVKDEVNQQRVRREAEDFLKAYDGKYQAYALFDIVDAYSDNDDIVIDSTGKRLPMLRQQQAESEFLCLADGVSDSVVSSYSFLKQSFDETLGAEG